MPRALKATTSRIEVYVRTNVFSLGSINTVDGTFEADFYLIASWVAVSSLVPAEGATSDEIKSIFDPGILVMNAKGVLEMQSEEFAVDTCRQGREGETVVTYRARIVGTFREPLELLRFPFDEQSLSVVISSSRVATEVSLHADPDRPSVLRFEFINTPEFVLSAVRYTKNVCVKRKFAMLAMSVTATRIPDYYVCNIFVPQVILSACAFAAFAISPDDLADRLSVVLTLVLASVAFKFTVSQDLPKIPYMTFLDRFVMGHFIFLGILTLENVLATVFSKTVTRRLDRIAFCILITAFLLVHVTLFAAIIYYSQTRPRIDPRMVSMRRYDRDTQV